MDSEAAAALGSDYLVAAFLSQKELDVEEVFMPIRLVKLKIKFLFYIDYTFIGQLLCRRILRILVVYFHEKLKSTGRIFINFDPEGSVQRQTTRNHRHRIKG